MAIVGWIPQGYTEAPEATPTEKVEVVKEEKAEEVKETPKAKKTTKK